MATERRKPIYGWGINDADYLVSYRPNPEIRNVQVMCPYYKRWHGMMWRVFKSYYSKATASYDKTTIDQSFQKFMDFRNWANAQGFGPDNGNLVDLDKDILFMGNNVYSQKTCVFVPKRINNLILTSEGKRKGTLLGTSFDGKKYTAARNINSKTGYIGRFSTEEQAHKAWQLAKADYMEDSIANYEQESESIGLVYRPDVVEAILKRSTLLRDAAESGKIINSL